jgi:hypothetical protein
LVAHVVVEFAVEWLGALVILIKTNHHHLLFDHVPLANKTHMPK